MADCGDDVADCGGYRTRCGQEVTARGDEVLECEDEVLWRGGDLRVSLDEVERCWGDVRFGIDGWTDKGDGIDVGRSSKIRWVRWDWKQRGKRGNCRRYEIQNEAEKCRRLLMTFLG